MAWYIAHNLTGFTPNSWLQTTEEHSDQQLLLSDFTGKNAVAASLRAHQPPQTNLPVYQNKELASRLSYVDAVQKAIQAIQAGKMDKVVLSRRKFIPLESNTAEALAHSLPQSVAGKFCYKLYNETTRQFWLGATPEILVQYQNKEYLSYALAGTAKNPEDFSQKEYEEQAIVARYIKKQLPNFAVSEGAVKQVDVRGMYHLKSELTWPGALEDCQKYVNQLHPTPAVCGVPVDPAKAFIEENEKGPRDLYTGYLGFTKGQEAAIMVNLRCGRLFNNGILLFAGGGITADSNPDQEFLETELKFEAIIRDLDL